MKKKFFLVIIAVFFNCKGLWANQADDFNYNKQQFQDEFADLSRLEQSVFDNHFITFSEMKSQKLIADEFSNLNLSNHLMIEPALGIPGFWWGCILGPIGIIAVYVISDKDQVETKKALTGCIVSGVAEIAFVVIYYVWLLSYMNTGI
ncbi:MAG: hypothetical protein WC780_12140 [Lentimicrobiaceae bacterium]|jgi:hypothetical protein